MFTACCPLGKLCSRHRMFASSQKDCSLYVYIVQPVMKDIAVYSNTKSCDLFPMQCSSENVLSPRHVPSIV